VVNTVNISENSAKVPNSSTPSISSNFFGETRALEVLGSLAVNVNGSAQDDLIVGNKGANTILGGAGNDMIFGGNGADVILGQQGNDILIGGSAYSVKGASVLASSSTVSSSADTINLGTGHMFNTGDAVQYVVGTGGAAITGLTTATTYYAIRVDDSTIKLATTALNADFGVAIDITAPTTAQTVKHFFVPNTAAQGSDFLSGGSGNDTLIALNAIGTSATAFDTVSMLGGSGNDKMVAFGNTGKVNAFGGTGNDLYQTWDDFNNIKVSGGLDAPSYTNSQKAMKVFDFAALNDDIVSTFASSTPESQLNTNGLTLNQLVAPPLPIVNGTGDNGNYSQASNQTVQSMDVGWSGSSTVSVVDLVNLHSAHAV
jgi:Ca2+-binding RTX toxin-like protein